MIDSEEGWGSVKRYFGVDGEKGRLDSEEEEVGVRSVQDSFRIVGTEGVVGREKIVDNLQVEGNLQLQQRHEQDR